MTKNPEFQKGGTKLCPESSGLHLFFSLKISNLNSSVFYIASDILQSQTTKLNKITNLEKQYKKHFWFFTDIYSI